MTDPTPAWSHTNPARTSLKERKPPCQKSSLFDTWGTLVDNYSIADVIEPYIFESHLAQKVAQDWRFQQKWAMFYLTLCDNFVPHPGLNEACLRWALDLHHVELSDAAIKDINAQYHKLRAYPDVLGALKQLKELGLTLKIVANPTKQMIEDHSKFAGTIEYLDEIISSGEEAQAFKPSPKVYHLGIERGRLRQGGYPLGHRTLLGDRRRPPSGPACRLDQPGPTATAADRLRADLHDEESSGARRHSEAGDELGRRSHSKSHAKREDTAMADQIRRKVTIRTLQKKMREGEAITQLAAYDYRTAVVADRLGMDILCVSDTGGMILFGHQSTVSVPASTRS